MKVLVQCHIWWKWLGEDQRRKVGFDFPQTSEILTLRNLDVSLVHRHEA